MSLIDEVNNRRTFAIISHPDAGKTTLTEKLLLYGGAIHLAGSVKARKTAKHAVSDWMEIEKQRGISVTSSVLQFDYEGHHINILDTPGHQDFSEDTYRTLMAADSAVMLIDVAKGVEAQTKKLFRVCKERGIPIFTFVNKIDHFGRNPFDLMDEIEDILGIHAYPMNWPIGLNGNYQGIYDRASSSIELFEKDTTHGQRKLASTKGSADDPIFKELLDEDVHQGLIDDIELLDEAGDEFDMEKVKRGELTPMFFGSAMTNFGVKPFLEEFLRMAPKPQPRKCLEGVVEPTSDQFTSFVFKIQANMNPQHHDRIVFMRICSGKFAKGMSVTHRQSGKTLRLMQPLADKKNVALRGEGMAPVEIQADEQKIRQLVLILVDNAVKYTPDGGQVTLRLETAEGGRVRFSVQDTGIGIAKADQDRIFDRFYRVDKARSRAMGGNGLGLAIAQEIVNLHQGKILVKSEPGQGTQFTVDFKAKTENKKVNLKNG